MAPVVADFLQGAAGREYGVGAKEKLQLLSRALLCSRKQGSALMWGEHVALARAILDIPRSVQGVVGEFGCFKGLSTCTLSLACKMTNRRLVVFDSFQGLPKTSEDVHNFDGTAIDYKEGHYRGTLDEVRQNVTAYGAIEVCEFVPGFFSDSLPQRPQDERFALIFEDADLPSSVKDVIRHTWKKLAPDCHFFTHEARDYEVVRIFFDQQWWRGELGEQPPGLVGSGIGLPLSRIGSGLAHTRRMHQR
jgi:O-methyltransferase